MKSRYRNLCSLLFLFILGLSGCTLNQSVSPVSSEEPLPTTEITLAVQPTATQTAAPTAIPLPLAAVVNGEGVLLSDFEEEYQRFLDGMLLTGTEVDQETGQAIVLEDLIVTSLLAQAARSGGFSLTEDVYQERLTRVITEAGGEAAFSQWLTDNHYSEESFQRSYRLSLEAAWMKDKITSAVPLEAEQVRARQIMVQSKTLADQIYQQLEAGMDFATIASIYDPISGGELGWFPKNTLVFPAIEDAVFILEPGEYTPVLDTDYGYQIIQVMERGVRSLTQDARLTYQNDALNHWISEQKNQSEIELIHE